LLFCLGHPVLPSSHFRLPIITEMTGVNTTASHWLRWGLIKFCPSWPWTSVLLISASQVGRIIGISHQHPAIT
jgi:hypothetical protein